MMNGLLCSTLPLDQKSEICSYGHTAGSTWHRVGVRAMKSHRSSPATYLKNGDSVVI